jgi:foldase protein PrsA
MLKSYRLIALALGASLAACAGGGSVATVNGQAISRSDFDAKLEGSPAARTTLQQMAQETLLDQYAKDNHISVTDADVTAKENQLKASFPSGSWDEMLSARGLSEDDVHRVIRDQLIVDKAVGKNITISNAQIAAYFAKNHASFDKPEQVRARHILVSDLATAEKVEAALKAGQKFEDLAKQYSIDPGSKDKGGELGWFHRGQMVPQFEAVAFSEPVGAISPPVKSPFGYHIIQVEEKQNAQTATIATAHDKIVDTLRQQQETPLVPQFLQGLVQKANIQINDPRFTGLFPSPPPGMPAGAPGAPPGGTGSPGTTGQ